MNHHPHYPGNLPAFQELYKEDREYFSDLFTVEFSKGFIPFNDSINLSDSDRLLFLSHFNAIGKMWNELSKVSRKKEESFKKQNSISKIDICEEYVILELLIDGEKRFVQTDPSGEIYDTDIPRSDNEDCCYPELAVKLASEYGRIWDDIDNQMWVFCRCLGYEFTWDEGGFILWGNGVKTMGSAWGNDCDSLFENLVAFS